LAIGYPVAIQRESAPLEPIVGHGHARCQRLSSHQRNAMSKSKLVGWLLSGLLAAFLIFASGMGKFVEFEGKAEMFEHIGYTSDLVKKIGVVEIAITLLFLIPRTGFLGAVLLTGYLGGATATHVRVGDPFFMPILIGIAVWVALGMRMPEVFRLALGKSETPNKP
jgi:hypothetical protein